MAKVDIGPSAFPCPMPMVIVGVEVEGRANYMPVGWVSRVNYAPPMIAIALGKSHYTNQGIRTMKEFSVCIPSLELMQTVDSAGLVSGKNEDKSGLFERFDGQLAHAPMVAACPVCMECRLVETVFLPSNELFIGEIVGAYADETIMVDGRPDPERIRPFSLTMPDNRYWSLGEMVGDAWRVGRENA